MSIIYKQKNKDFGEVILDYLLDLIIFPKKEMVMKALTLLVVVSLSLISSPVYAWYSDVEDSSSNVLAASSLDFSLSSPVEFAPKVSPTESSLRNISVINDGILGFKYQVHIENITGDTSFCEALELDAELDAGNQYTGTLSSFATTSPYTFSSTEEWDLTVDLNGSDASFQNKTCTFDFVYEGWQEDFSYGDGGFTDIETISLTITADAWQDVWIQTTEGDFEGGEELFGVDTDTTSGDVQLPVSGSDTTNLALNQPVTAAAEDNSHIASHATDGDTGTFWKNDSSSTATPPWWLRVDLGSSKEINSVDLLFNTPSPQIPVDYTIQISLDDINWTTVATTTGNASVSNLHSFDPVTTRYVRAHITAMSNSNGQPAIKEFMVYGPAYSIVTDGIITSSPFNGSATQKWISLEWDETTPTGTNIDLEVRTSNDDITWSSWSLNSGTSPIDLSTLPETQYIQWRATLSTTVAANTPVLHEVRLYHEAGAASEHVVLNEFLANPSGTTPDYGFDFGEDADLMPQGEWVELYNNAGGPAADLSGWYITNSLGDVINITNVNTDTGTSVIGEEDWLVVYMNAEILDNTTETISLYDQNDVLVDTVSYSTAVPGNKSYARIPDGIGAWIDPIPTPSSPNILEEVEVVESVSATQVIVEIPAEEEPITEEVIEEMEVEEVPVEEELIIDEVPAEEEQPVEIVEDIIIEEVIVEEPIEFVVEDIVVVEEQPVIEIIPEKTVVEEEI